LFSYLLLLWKLLFQQLFFTNLRLSNINRIWWNRIPNLFIQVRLDLNFLFIKLRNWFFLHSISFLFFCSFTFLFDIHCLNYARWSKYFKFWLLICQRQILDLLASNFRQWLISIHKMLAFIIPCKLRLFENRVHFISKHDKVINLHVAYFEFLLFIFLFQNLL